MRLKKDTTLVMIGDSITDCGRARPRGEGRGDATGKGYVSLVDAWLQAVYPDCPVRLINMGNSGDSVRQLRDRWEPDVLDLKPDWLSVMIGINDVWRQFDVPRIKQQHVYIDEYEEAYRSLLERTRPHLQGLVLMSPFYLEPNRQDPMRAAMDEYGKVVRALAMDYDALFVDTQAALDKVLKHIYPAALAWDRVHPNMAGHAVLARAFLNAIGFDWERSAQ